MSCLANELHKKRRVSNRDSGSTGAQGVQLVPSEVQNLRQRTRTAGSRTPADGEHQSSFGIRLKASELLY